MEATLRAFSPTSNRFNRSAVSRGFIVRYPNVLEQFRVVASQTHLQAGQDELSRDVPDRRTAVGSARACRPPHRHFLPGSLLPATANFIKPLSCGSNALKGSVGQPPEPAKFVAAP
jgi:hypothetical protein